MRTVIVGGPRTGKTTFAKKTAGVRPVHHTDDVAYMEWSRQSREVATWFDRPGPWVIEGTAAVRALRKWLRSHPLGKPADEVIFLTSSYEVLTPGQLTMGQGVATVLRQIQMELWARGVQVREL